MIIDSDVESVPHELRPSTDAVLEMEAVVRNRQLVPLRDGGGVRFGP